jgi:hypothetical protein
MEENSRAVKLLLSFDPKPGPREAYFRYMMGEFIPTMESMGLRLVEAWHTAYGPYPLRLTGFVAEDRQQLEQILASDDFRALEQKLLEYVQNYHRRVVPLHRRFQF